MDSLLLVCTIYFHDGRKSTIEYGPFATTAAVWQQIEAHHYVSEHWFKDHGSTCICVGCSDPVIDFDIRPQPLARALTTLADQANLQILFTTKSVERLTTPGIKGAMTAAAAVRALIAGMSLESVRKRADVFVVRSAN